MKKVVLVGNPNVGKSLLFSRITGIGVVTANYPGTTVEIKIGKFQYREEEYELIDGPGLYSLEIFSKSDKTAANLIDENDLIINVIDATNFERNLNLTLQLLKKNKPMVVCLNFWEDTAHKGITIDYKELENILGVPVIPVSALTTEGVNELVARIKEAKQGQLSIPNYSTEVAVDGICANNCSECTLNCNNWKFVGYIVQKVQKLEHRHHTFLENLSDFTLNPFWGIISAIIVLISTLYIVRFCGEGLTNYILTPFYEKLYSPFIMHLANYVPSELVKGLLVGHSVDPLQSFGIFTSGVYIALVLVFPYFLSFYFIFGVLEDFGYLPRLAVILDNFFHKLGLHGYSAIPVMLGLGCKVPAIMSTRVLTNKREKILTTALLLMAVPCLPQTAMIVSLGMPYGVHTIITIFAILAVFSLIVNFILNKLLPGDPTDLFTEVPSYRIPSIKLMLGKLKIRIVDYFGEVLPLIVGGVLIMNVLDSIGFINFITYTLKDPVKNLLGLPPDIASIMILGFLRKDVSIALLAPLHLDTYQFIVACVFLVLYIPCISSFFTLVKELGAAAFKVVGIIFTSTLIFSCILHLFFTFIK